MPGSQRGFEQERRLYFGKYFLYQISFVAHHLSQLVSMYGSRKFSKSLSEDLGVHIFES